MISYAAVVSSSASSASVPPSPSLSPSPAVPTRPSPPPAPIHVSAYRAIKPNIAYDLEFPPVVSLPPIRTSGAIDNLSHQKQHQQQLVQNTICRRLEKPFHKKLGTGRDVPFTVRGPVTSDTPPMSPVSHHGSTASATADPPQQHLEPVPLLPACQLDIVRIRRSRKAPHPRKSPSRRADRAPGVVLQFTVGTSVDASTPIVTVVKRPEDYRYCFPSSSTSSNGDGGGKMNGVMGRRLKRTRAESDPLVMKKQQQGQDTPFPISEAFFSGFADRPGGNAQMSTRRWRRRTSSCLQSNNSSNYGGISCNALDMDVNSSLSLATSSSSASPFSSIHSGHSSALMLDAMSDTTSSDSNFDDSATSPASDVMVRKKPSASKKKPPVKRRTSKASRSGVDKICISCKSTQTPIWREVKEAWGDGWDEVLLCNACGLQWRMSGLRCTDCLYVPRASEKRSKKCTRCDHGKWYRKN